MRSDKIAVLKQIVMKFREIRSRAGVEETVTDLDAVADLEEQDCGDQHGI